VVRPDEQARRLKAAIAYSGHNDDTIAQAAGTSVRSLRRWKRDGIPHDADPRVVRQLVEACGVPYAWFTADFRHLWKIPQSPEDAFIEAAMDAGQPRPAQHERRVGHGRRADDPR
jgi:hypothetical protein